MIRHVQISEQTTYDLECHGIQPWFLSCRKLHPNLPVVILHAGKSAGNFTAKIVGKWMFHTKYSMFYLCFLICEKKHFPPNPGGVPPSLIFEVVIIMISLRMFKIDKQRLQFHIHEIYRFVTTPKQKKGTSKTFKKLLFSEELIRLKPPLSFGEPWKVFKPFSKGRFALLQREEFDARHFWKMEIYPTMRIV